MSNSNPYIPVQDVSAPDFGIRKVHVRPIELIKRAYALVGDQYWLFLGITLVAVLVGSAVPLGLIMGAMMAGIFLCYIHREQGIRVELSTVFRGFDYFVESLLAMLVLLAASMLVIIPFMIVMFVLVMMPVMASAANGGNGPPGPPTVSLTMFFVLYPVMMIANMFVTVPFLFVFQLIVDRNVKAMAAVRLSFRGVVKNFWGVLGFVIVLMFVSLILTMMCYVPAILFMPISFGAMYLLYRDIYGPGIQRTGPYDQGPQLTSPPGTSSEDPPATPQSSVG